MVPVRVRLSRLMKRKYVIVGACVLILACIIPMEPWKAYPNCSYAAQDSFHYFVSNEDIQKRVCSWPEIQVGLCNVGDTVTKVFSPIDSCMVNIIPEGIPFPPR